MRVLSTLIVTLFALQSFGQFGSNPCAAGPLPIQCAPNTVSTTTAYTNSGVEDPESENGTGCSSVGSDITAGTIYDYDGWFTTTADAAGVVDVYAAIISGDPVVGLYSLSGSCATPSNLTLLGCDDDGGTGLDAYINITGLTPGATYYVRIWDYLGGTGTYEVTTNGGTPPANDDCSNAAGLTVNAAPIGGTNYCSTIETSDWNDCENNTENNVWYSFTTSQDGDITVNFSSVDCFGSGAGIDVTVFYGNCASFSSYGCTSVNAGSTGNISEFYGPAGTYYVMVDGNNSGGATSLCEFDVDVDFVGCPADAGTNTTPDQNVCYGVDVNVTTVGSTNTNQGTDPCIGWGFWVESDPLGVFTGMSGIGTPPSGNNPAGTGGDPNFDGVYTSVSFPNANGPSATLPNEGNGVTYYIAPITLSNCATGEITTNCFDIGDVATVYFNPEIVYTTVIDCYTSFPSPVTTQVSIAIAGGTPAVDGSNFTLTNNGDGTLSSTTVGDGGTVTVTGIPDGGDLDILITDATGCTQTITISGIDATAYCPTCSADAGSTTATLTGDGSSSGFQYTLCYGDVLDISTIGYTNADDPDFCGNPPGPDNYDGATTGSCNPDIVYGYFTTLAQTANPFIDSNFVFLGAVGPDQSYTNNGSLVNFLINNGNDIQDNTVILYPVTADVTDIDLDNNGSANNWSEDEDGDGCFDSGSPIVITFLNDITADIVQGCAGPELTLFGGHSEFNPTNYSITNNGSGTVTGAPAGHGETITITGLSNGGSYDITVTDANGCSVNFVGTYSYTQPTLAINGLATDFCNGDPVDAFSVSPGNSSTTTVSTGSFDIDFVSDGYTGELTWQLEDNSGTIIASGGPYFGNNAGVDLATVTVDNLTIADGPFFLVLFDAYSDGQDGTWSPFGTTGSTTVTNNVTGSVVATVSGDWGATTTLSLGTFTPVNITTTATATITGTNITDNGDATGSFNPTTDGTHTITFTYLSEDGCTYTETQDVTVHPLPVLANPTDPEICADETLLLSDYSPGEADGVPGTGTWYTNPGFTTTAPTTAFTPVNGTQYYYEYVSTAGGCTDDASITVTVNPNPTADAGSAVVIDCNSVGGEESLDGSGSTTGMDYNWVASGGGNIVSGGTTTTPVVDAAGTYTLTVTNPATGCTDTDVVTVTEDLVDPTASAVSPVIIDCNSTGGEETLDGSASSGSMNYNWVASAGGNIVSGGTSTTPVVDAAGTYTLTVTNPTNGCTADAVVTVTEDLVDPTASAVSPVVIDCNSTGGEETLDGSASSGSMNYNWVASAGGNIVSGGTSTTPVVDAAGTYTLTVTNPTNGCTADAVVTVTEDLVDPTASAVSPVVIDCNSTGGEETLDGSASSGSMNYNWIASGGGNIVSGGTSTTPVVDAAGTYTLTVSNPTNGCTADAVVTVTEDLVDPTASAVSPVVIDCSSPGGQEVLDGTASTDGMTYSWTTPDGTIVSGAATESVTVSAAGTYTIEVTNPSNGCSATDDVVVTEDSNIPTAEAGSPVIINCNSVGGEEVLDGTPSTDGMDYLWTTPDGTIVSGATTESVTVSAAGTYTITVTNTSNGCVATDNVVVTEDLTPPTADAGTTVEIDCNSVGGEESLDGSGSTAAMDYNWTTVGGNIVSGGTTTTPVVDAPGTYTITVLNTANGCSATDDVVVTEDITPPTADAGSDVTTTCSAPTASLTGGATGGTSPYSYSWDNGIGAVQNPTVDPAVSTTYVLTVTGANGCVDTDDVLVTVDEDVPTIDPITNDAGCDGETLGGYTLSGTPTSGVTYDWTNSNTSIGLGASGSGNIGSFTGTNSGSTPVTGTIDITAEVTASGCQATASFDITINPVPVLSATTDPEVCADANSINLGSLTPSETLGVAGSGQWYTGTDNTGTPVSGSQIGLSNGDQFYYEYTATSGSCTDDATITVTVNPVPVLDAVTNPEVCADANTIDLGALTPSETAGVAGTGQWYTGTSNAGTPVSGSQTVTNGDQFFYEYTSTTGSCTDDVTITVTVNPVPVLSNVTNPAVCADANSIDLSTLTPSETAGVPGTGQWYTGTDNTGTPVTGVQSGLSNGDQFYYEYTSTAGSCVDGHLLTVTVNPLPVLSSVTDPEVCADANTIDLGALTPSETAGVAGTGQWYAGTSNTDPAVSGVQTVNNGDQFYYEYTSTTGSCTADLTITVTVNPLPTATDQSAPGACEDTPGSGTIAGVDLTSYESAVNGGAGITYNWYSDAGLSTLVGTPSSVTVSDGDIYYVEVIDGTTSCSDVAQVDFTVFTIPSVNNLTPSVCEDALGSGQTSGVDLTGNNTGINGGAGITYTWYTDVGLSSAVATPSNTTVNDNDIFYVEVDNGNCTDVATVTYSVTSTITLTDPNPQLCEDVAGGGTYAGYDLTTINSSVYAGGGGTTYTWYESDMSTLVGTPNNITLNDGDQYYVDIVDGNCSNAIMVNFNVNSLPTVSPVADLELCDEGGSMATFDLTSVESGVNATGPNYYWFSDAGLSTSIGAPNAYSSASGTVYVQVEDANGCLNDIDVNLVVNPLPTATTASLEECNTGSNQATFDLTSVESTVDGGAGNTINWYSDAVLATSISTPGAYQTVSTTVYAEVIDGNTCANSVGVSLTVNPLPTATDQNPAGVCEDAPGSGTATIDLTSYEAAINGGAGVTINWFSDASLSTAVGTPNSELAANGGVYYAQVIDNVTLCEDTAEVTITVLSSPTATDLTPSLCEDVLGSGQTSGVDLTANNTNINNGAGLTFTWYDDASLSSATASPTNATINNGDTYYVEISNGNCTSVAQVDYTVTSTITLNDPLPSECESTLGSGQFTGYDLTSLNNSVYSGSGSTVYTWYESDMTTPVVGSNNILLGDGDQYYLEVVDGNCSNGIMITFTVNPLPTMNSVSALELCDDGSGQATFDLTSEEANINGTGPTYNWYSDAGLTTSIASPGAYTSATGTAYLEVVDGNGCSNSYGLDLTVNPLPTANTTSQDICDDGTGQATFDLTSLESTVDGGAGNTIDWYSDSGLTTSITTPATYTSGSTTVYAEVTDATTGCTNNTTVVLNVTAAPSAPLLAGGSTYCEGDAIADLTANGGGGTITWYSDNTLSTVVGTGGTFSPTLSGTGSETYYVVEDLGGCISEVDSVIVTVNANPVADFTTNTTNGNVPLDVEFTDASTGNGLTYNWDFGDGETSTTQNPSNTFDELGTYTTVLTVTDNNGCMDTTSTHITVAGESVLIIPNIFSPNGDGNNDVWNIEGTNITEITGTIMNRWGQVMFQFDLLEMGWDGRTNAGLEASEGTYYYIVDAVGQDGTVYNYQGPFQLVR